MFSTRGPGGGSRCEKCKTVKKYGIEEGIAKPQQMGFKEGGAWDGVPSFLQKKGGSEPSAGARGCKSRNQWGAIESHPGIKERKGSASKKGAIQVEKTRGLGGSGEKGNLLFQGEGGGI